jgi:CelD/BcsL family acetyltransferase involved in cellulose biosynthesis
MMSEIMTSLPSEDRLPLATAKESSRVRPNLGRAAETGDIAFSAIEVHRDPKAVVATWAELEAVAPISVYQTRAFLLHWLKTLGAARGIAPMFIIAKDRQDRAVALLCLGVETRGIFRVARFLGGKESNLNLGLFRPGIDFTAADIEILLRHAAKALGSEAPDVFALQNQPVEWRKTKNPLALLAHQESPSFVYAMSLGPDSETILAAKLTDPQKKLHRKELRLARIGPVALISNDTPAHTDAILDAFFVQKIARCHALGFDADFSDPAQRAFLESLSRPSEGKPPCVAFYALMAGERIVATSAGASHSGCFSGMVNSFDMDPEIAKTSPGELLLRKLIVAECQKKLDMLEFGIGEAHYKAHYHDWTVPLFDLLLPIGDKGRVFALYEASRLRLKAAIKANRPLFDNFRRLQRLVQGQKPG